MTVDADGQCYVVDASCVRDGNWTSFMNCAASAGAGNVVLKIVRGTPISFVGDADIPEGDELTFVYNDGFTTSLNLCAEANPLVSVGPRGSCGCGAAPAVALARKRQRTAVRRWLGRVKPASGSAPSPCASALQRAPATRAALGEVAALAVLPGSGVLCVGLTNSVRALQ